MTKKRFAALWLSAALCLLMFLPGAKAETRQGVIYLEGMEEPIEETLFESPQGISFWYVSDVLEARLEKSGDAEIVVVDALYSDNHMTLSMISEEEAVKYAKDPDADIARQSSSSRVQEDVYWELKNRTFRFLTLIAENGQYLKAEGEYAMEAAEGLGKYFQRVLDSVALMSEYDAAFLRDLPGEWIGESDEAKAVLTLEKGGEMSLDGRGADGSFAYSYQGAWSYEPVPNRAGNLTLRFTSTDNPSRAQDEYNVERAYLAYTESWMDGDTLITFLILNRPEDDGGPSPFVDIYGYDGVALTREQKPNMRVANCREYVSLWEGRSTSSKRLTSVPLGDLVLAFPQEGEEDGFIRCVYQNQEGYILSEYLQSVE